MTPERIEELRRFIGDFSWAVANGMQLEWLDTFLTEFASTEDVKLSCYTASREWDLWTTIALELVGGVN